jgi:AcrR family transcriptional regulator
MRADAQRNREHILRVAAHAFATEGLAVSVHEIAARAGVGTGTVSRHFPSKVDLYAAVLLDQMRLVIEKADELAATVPAGDQFFPFFRLLVEIGAAHNGLAEALAGADYDIDAAGAAAGFDIFGRLQALLAAAQHAGTVKADLTYLDVKALMTGCLTRGAEPAALDRVITVVTEGMRAP